MHRKICVKGFSGITPLRFSKFCTNPGYDYLYRTSIVWERIGIPILIIPFICPFFFISNGLFVKDFSGTTASKILKFCTNVGYDLLYRVREIQHAHAYHSLYLSIFLFLQNRFSSQFFSSYESSSLQILYTPTCTKNWSILCKRNPWCWNLFCPLFFY